MKWVELLLFTTTASNITFCMSLHEENKLVDPFVTSIHYKTVSKPHYKWSKKITIPCHVHTPTREGSNELERRELFYWLIYSIMQELQLLLFPFAILPIPIRFVWSYVPIPIRFVSAYKKWSWYNSLVPYKEKVLTDHRVGNESTTKNKIGTSPTWGWEDWKSILTTLSPFSIILSSWLPLVVNRST